MFKALTKDGDTHSSHSRLSDAIDQADMIHGRVEWRDKRIFVVGWQGDREYGCLARIDGTTALIRWDQGIVTEVDTDAVFAAE